MPENPVVPRKSAWFLAFWLSTLSAMSVHLAKNAVDKHLVDVVDKDEKTAWFLAFRLSTLSTTPKSLFCYIFEEKKS
jgi:hypothetical protein